MAYEHLLSTEELMAAREEAKIRRHEQITQAISNGATIHYCSTSLTEDERETIINVSEADQTAYACTSIARDITKFLTRGWEITSVTYKEGSRDPKDNSVGIVEMTFKAPARCVTIGSNKGTLSQINSEL